MNFKKGSYVCMVNRDKYEPYEWYIQRGHFVACQKPQTENEYNEVIRLSKIYTNIRFQQCKYDKELMEKISEMEQRMYNS